LVHLISYMTTYRVAQNKYPADKNHQNVHNGEDMHGMCTITGKCSSIIFKIKIGIITKT